MSHRLIAEAAQHDAQLRALDVTIADLRRAAVVDFARLVAARQERGRLLGRIAETEKALAR